MINSIKLAPRSRKDIKPVRAGTKRHTIILALQKGVTMEDLVKISGWEKRSVSGFFTYDLPAVGLGVERKGDIYHLRLPKGMTSVPVKEPAQKSEFVVKVTKARKRTRAKA